MNDDVWNENVRGETPIERLDRNWSFLLQEMRVIQTGIQLLTGFLLTLPFQSRFTGLSDRDLTIYLVTLTASALATVFLVTPVAMHRVLFRRHAIASVVRWANRLAVAGLVLLGVAVIGVVTLIFDVVVDETAGLVVGVAVAVAAIALWAVLPLSIRRHTP
ncbi:MAG: DUF6328 family protein [Corynebacteriales bacterium]|uniref:DUF6328 family protein n=1 Tax=Williamsia herbipolensis TaxID=1603258 RepID=A0AAU4K0W5_9NOCA|nr:DUF6328 family protein [Williamsia herbipolensis]MCX6468542.1 DUF6328 family protein [Mycobacteriales bacterium]